MRNHLTAHQIRKYLLTGVFVWVPIVITVAVFAWGMGILQNIFTSIVDVIASVLPNSMQDGILFFKNIPGLGVILVLILLFGTGVMATNFLGQWFLRVLNTFLSRIPIVKSVYGSVKQVSDTLFSSNGQAFRQALLVQYPRSGVWTVAFQTGTPEGEVAAKLPTDCVSVYIPTTPNPTSGFFLIMQKTDVMPLNMSVDEALKYIISMGVVSPDSHTPDHVQGESALASIEKKEIL